MRSGIASVRGARLAELHLDEGHLGPAQAAEVSRNSHSLMSATASEDPPVAGCTKEEDKDDHDDGQWSSGYSTRDL